MSATRATMQRLMTIIDNFSVFFTPVQTLDLVSMV